jgi:hypothetical protein
MEEFKDDDMIQIPDDEDEDFQGGNHILMTQQAVNPPSR